MNLVILKFFENKLNISQTYYNMKLMNEINGFTSDGNGGYTLNMTNKSYRKGLETQIEMFINNNSKVTLKHDYVDSTSLIAQLKNRFLK